LIFVRYSISSSSPSRDCVAMRCSPFDHANLPWPLFFKEGYYYGIVRN
jgi:hypothetical protein